MAPTSRFPWPQRTTLTAGVLLLVSALLLLIVRSRAALPVTGTITIPLGGPVVAFAEAAVHGAAFLVAALGIAGEVGIAGGSRLGRTALVVWGVRDLVLAVLGSVATGSGPGASVLVVLGTALSVLFPAAAVVAAVVVVRAEVLSGLARWVLVPVAVLACASGSLSFLPAPVVLGVATALVAVPIELLDPVLTALVGIAFLLWSRMEAVKHRARTAYEAW